MSVSTSCNWTGHIAPTPVADRIEKLERLRAALAATSVNLTAYQRRPDASPHVVAEAWTRVGILILQIRVAEWSVRRVRGY